jgi:HK97 gp10 family phage protein
MARRGTTGRVGGSAGGNGYHVTVDDAAYKAALMVWADRYETETRADLFRLGVIIQNDARRRCPVDTGRLRSSITVKRSAQGVTVGSNVEYAGYVEYGTRHMAAQPYLRPAVATAASRWASVVRS